MLPSYPLTLASSTDDGATLANSTVATSILHGSGIAVIPAGALQKGGQLDIDIVGRISTVVTTPGTLTFDLRFGGVIISALGAINLNVNAQTNASFRVRLKAVIRALGKAAGANALVTAEFISRALIGSGAVNVSGNGVLMLPDTAPAVGTGFDSSSALAVDVFATWSIANAANSLTVHQSLTEFKV